MRSATVHLLTPRFQSLLIFGACAVTSIPCDGQDKASILAAWSKRSQAVETAVFEWKETVVLGKHSQFDPVNPRKKWPETEKRFEYQKRLVFDRGQIRSTWNVVGRPKEMFDTAFAGGISTGLHGTPRRDNDAFPSASVTRAKDFSSAHYPFLLPALWSCRLQNNQFVTDFDAGGFTLENRTGAIDGRPCLILTYESSPGRVNEYWVAPELDYAVLRRVRTDRGVLARQWDVEYGKDETIGWVPSSWQLTIVGPSGQIEEARSSEIERYAFNTILEEDAFTVSFPSGTIVNDHVEKVRYLVTGDGTRRVIRPNERRATYKQIRDSPSGEALLPKSQSRRNRLMLYGGLLGGVVLVWFWRARSRNSD